MPNQQLKKEMVERGKGKIAKLIGRIAIYNEKKWLRGAKEKLPNLSEELLFIIVLKKRIFVSY